MKPGCGQARAHMMGQGLAVGPCGGQERLPRGRGELARRKGSGQVFGEADTEFTDRLTYPLATAAQCLGRTILKGAHVSVLVSFTIRKK